MNIMLLFVGDDHHVVVCHAKLRRERREAAKTDPSRAAEELPDSFYKLPRIRFLLILCKEINRINR